MTDIEKAIEILKNSNIVLEKNIELMKSRLTVFGRDCSKYPVVLENFINKYEAQKLAISALEKQMPYKPKMSDSGMFYICSCDKLVEKTIYQHGDIIIPFCRWCGQKIDWSDT